MQRKTFGLILMVIGALLGVLAVASYIHTRPSNTDVAGELGNYFAERMFEEGTKNGLIPIEGFDADLLIGAFPALTTADFEGVETLEGVYSVKNGELIFTRTRGQPISSAERTVSKTGYATLLGNLSLRMDYPVHEQKDVDALIELLHARGGTMTVRLDETKTLLDVVVTPLEVVEDSRCPIDVVCVWEGTVKLRAMLGSGLGTAEQVFELGQPVTTEAEEVTLILVEPFPQSESSLTESEYVFHFSVTKR